ncbi:hypothetical protein EDC94DRAFT_690495 [Helicostylum pulchrum]|nr:hypothetical protein EDC94DRAFT_690495 [Helicostylum pulchrum]
MEIIFNIGDFPDPGDRDLRRGINEINKNSYRTALKHFERASVYDNEYAALFKAIIYFTGFDLTKRDPLKAIQLFKEIASNWDNPVAQYFIAIMYFEGDQGIPQDKKSGFHWFSLAAHSGWLYAMGYMGYAYNFGESVTKDQNKALYWFKKVVKNDDNDSGLIDDGTIYLFGNKRFLLNSSHVDRNVIAAVDSNTRSKLASPIKYLKEIDHTTSTTEIQRLTIWDILTNKKSSGVAACQFYISTIYANIKTDYPQDIGEAFRWASKAAKNRCPLSCRFIALHYEYGNVVKQDYKQAMKWYELSCDFGDPVESLFRIGTLHYDGKGVKRDHKMALDYFKDTITYSNHGEAFFLIGEIYKLGQDGVVQNYRRAYQCYSRAFGYGIVPAGTEIGLFYCKGLGVCPDRGKACEWLSKAAALDCTLALHVLNSIQTDGFDRVTSTITEIETGEISLLK